MSELKSSTPDPSHPRNTPETLHQHALSPALLLEINLPCESSHKEIARVCTQGNSQEFDRSASMTFGKGVLKMTLFPKQYIVPTILGGAA